jgi:AcrR family transcriptional regulator
MLEAAVRILLAEGYARLNTRRVAQLAGVSVGSLYQYFPNRQAIVAEIIRRKVHAGVACIEAAAARAEGPVVPALAGVMEAFAAEKRRGLAVAHALREPIAALQGRQALADSARQVEAVLAALLARLLGRPLAGAAAARLRFAMAGLEGVVAAAAEHDPDAFGDPGFGPMLARMLAGALDLERAGLPGRAPRLPDPPGQGAVSPCNPGVPSARR